MSAKPIKLVGAAVLAVAGAAGSFTLTTVVMDQMPDALLIGVTTLLAALVVVTIRAAGLGRFLQATPPRDLIIAALGGAAAFWVAPLVVLSQRASDAPSGSEVLFFTTAMWGPIAVAVAVVVLQERPAWAGFAGAALAVAGAAALLANWERPSSFSPFAKFPEQEIVMLGAGAVFALGSAAILMVARKHDNRLVAAVAAGGAGLLSAVVAVFSLGDYGQTIVRLSTELILLGVSQAAFIGGWTSLTHERGLLRSSSVLLSIPAVMTTLFVVERVTGIFGPIPFQIPAVVAGALVCLAGAVSVWIAGTGTAAPAATSGRLAEVAGFLAWLGLAGAAVALFRPALSAAAQGVLGDGFSATWVMVGAESAAGWILFAAALALLAAVRTRRMGSPSATWVSLLVAALVALAASPMLIDTTLHTWNQWVPAAVQQTYGTEYARFSVEALVDPVWIGSAVLVVLSAVLLLSSVLIDRRRAARPELEETQ